MSSEKTETFCRAKGQKLIWFKFTVRMRTVKSWPIDPLVYVYIILEVSEKLPQG